MERGVLRYLLLDALRDGPKHGYELIRSLEERTHGFYSPSPGVIYPTLQLLEDQGFVRADQDQERRVYHLTDAGRAELQAHAEMVQAVWARFAGRAPSGAGRQEALFLRDEMGSLVRTVWVGARGALQRGDLETLRQVRQVLERARNEVREILSRAADSETPAAPSGPVTPSPDAGTTL